MERVAQSPRETPLAVAPLIAGRYRIGKRVGADPFVELLEAFDTTSNDARVLMTRVRQTVVESDVEQRALVSVSRGRWKSCSPIDTVFGEALYIVEKWPEGTLLSHLVRERTPRQLSISELLAVVEGLDEVIRANPEAWHGALAMRRIAVGPTGLTCISPWCMSALPSARRLRVLAGSTDVGVWFAPELETPMNTNGTAGSCVDRWGVGALVLEALTGRRPDEVRRVPLPPALARVDREMNALLETDPAKRATSLDELVEALHVAQDRGVVATNETDTTPRSRVLSSPVPLPSGDGTQRGHVEASAAEEHAPRKSIPSAQQKFSFEAVPSLPASPFPTSSSERYDSFEGHDELTEQLDPEDLDDVDELDEEDLAYDTLAFDNAEPISGGPMSFPPEARVVALEPHTKIGVHPDVPRGEEVISGPAHFEEEQALATTEGSGPLRRDATTRTPTPTPRSMDDFDDSGRVSHATIVIRRPKDRATSTAWTIAVSLVMAAFILLVALAYKRSRDRHEDELVRRRLQQRYEQIERTTPK